MKLPPALEIVGVEEGCAIGCGCGESESPPEVDHILDAGVHPLAGVSREEERALTEPLSGPGAVSR
jgi:hypothetical protein